MDATGGQNIKFIRRGGIYCARRRVSEANRRAAAALRPEIPPGDVCGAAGCGGMRASRPTADRMVMAAPGGQNIKFIRRGGIYPARGTSRRHGVPGTISGLRAGPYGPVGLRNAPAGAVRASSPTRVCYNVKFAVSRFTAAFAVGRRGGFHIRPGVFAAPRGAAG